MTETKFPSFNEFIEPLLRVLAEHPEGLSRQDATELVAGRKGLSEADRAILVPSGTVLAYKHRVGWAHDSLKRARLSHSPKQGFWQLTSAGVEYAARYPALNAEQIRELAHAYRERSASGTAEEDDDDLPPPGSARSGAGFRAGGKQIEQANVQALGIVRQILEATSPSELKIRGKTVTLSEHPAQASSRWPTIAGLVEAEHGPWPSTRVWTCEWEGGHVEFALAAAKTNAHKTAPKGVGFRLRADDLELIWVDVAAYIRRPSKEDVARVRADFALKKHVADRSNNPNTVMTEAIGDLLREHGIEPTKSSIDAVNIRKDSGEFTPPPEEALRRLLILGLLKLDFFHSSPGQVAQRGKPLIDLTELGFAKEEAEDVEGDEAPDDLPPEDLPLNLILFGPPGTGKTFEIQRSYEPKFRDAEDTNCRFITFHQSYTYEDFIEGIRPSLTNDEHTNLRYELTEGIFLKCANEALRLAEFNGSMTDFCRLSTAERRNYFEKATPYALFIDEINRGNVSRVFGELITLLEEDKRLGEKNEIIVELPYSHTLFGVPANLHLIGTMNTADRSVEALDTALRRRFKFRELPPKPSLLHFEIEGVRVDELLATINRRIEKLRDRDHALGHAYFMSLKDVDATLDDLKAVFRDSILPLLQEYFFGDFGRIGLILGPKFVKRVVANDVTFAKFEHEDAEALMDRTVYEFAKVEDLTADDFKSIYA
ncbi:MAG: AAA family ATPase [Polyangiaceae bacterium]|nr:AAA family ATPase [Polyangiaceae bacterium]